MNRNELYHYNRFAWDQAVIHGSEWTIPVTTAQIDAARQGDWQIVLTPTKPVPRAWFPQLLGAKVLCLAGAGGQQGPILAAAGAQVTVLDASPRQLAQDQLVAQRDGLAVTTIEGDMAHLDGLADSSFDLIVHPCSNLFVPDVHAVWREAHRVLKPGGLLLAGFCNPASYIFDQRLADDGILQVRHTLPYSDLASLSDAERQEYIDDEQPMEFSHTLDDQLGGQLAAGFVLTGFYEDSWPGRTLDAYMPTFIATRALKG